jgi:hypothetical protein
MSLAEISFFINLLIRPRYFFLIYLDGVCKGSASLLSAASRTMRQLLAELQFRHEGKKQLILATYKLF